MRAVLFLLALLSLSWAVSFGRSVLEIERVWDITSEGAYNFTGALAANDSFQRIVSISTEPEAAVVADGDNILVMHSGNGSGMLRASAVVLVEYDAGVASDSPLPSAALPAEGLTAADDAIRSKAKTLATDGSALYTVRDIVNWLHTSVAYDLGYSGRVSPATEVFRDRRGVCVEYSHLLISMLRSLGLESRYVSGYVLDDSWQPHAWAEVYVPGHGWLAADPTLGQAGALDNSHLAIQKKEDHSQAYDILVSGDRNAALSVTDSITVRSLSENPEDVSLSIDMDPDTLAVEVVVENSRPRYVFGVYGFSAPDGRNGDSSAVMLLKPYERVRRYHGLNNSLFRDDFIYDIQVSASFNDATEGRLFSVDRRAGNAPEPLPDSYYSIPVVIAVLIALAILTSKRG